MPLLLAVPYSYSLGGFALHYSWTVLRSQMKEGVAEDLSAGTHKGMGLAVEEKCCSPDDRGQRLVDEVKHYPSLVFVLEC